MAFNIKDKIAQVAKSGPNMTESQKGGGYTPPEAGFVRLRLVGYYEVGQHVMKYGAAKGKVKPIVRLVWELSGPKHPPRDTDEGKVPLRLTQDLTYSLNEKANFHKLFKAMNYSGKFTHMAEMLGEPFVGNIEHVKKGEGESAKTYANLVNIRAPRVSVPVLDEEGQPTGEEKVSAVNVDPPLSEIKGFIWDYSDAEMWDSIYIPGEWEEKKDEKGNVTHPAKSKNVLQLEIMAAVNFKGCPIYDYATGKVKKADVDAMAAELANISESDAAQAAAPEDALEGIA